MMKSALVWGLTLQKGTMLGAKPSSRMGDHLVPEFPLVLELSAKGVMAGEWMATHFSPLLPSGLSLPLGRGWDRSRQPKWGG